MRCALYLCSAAVVLCACGRGQKEIQQGSNSSADEKGEVGPIGDGDNSSSPGDGDDNALSHNPWDATSSGVFVHLFEWPWTDIATECEEFLGPAGYSAVQVSPPQEHAVIQGRPWWERYQPVSYSLESRSGDETAFVDMVQRCRVAGVDIYVDAVINHMSAQESGTGSGGTEFTKYNFGETWQPEDFHIPICGIEQGDYVADRDAVQNCELLGLADLNTSAENVQRELADYLLRLIDLGVAGFRIDAAKHMSPEDLGDVLDMVSSGTDFSPFVFLEVIEGTGEAITSADYLELIVGGQPVSITEFRYQGMGEKFRVPTAMGELAGFTPDNWGLLGSERAVVFTDNHDTQRGDSIHYVDGASHQLANVFLLAHPYGYPQLMSSYAFTPGGSRDGPLMDDKGISLGPHNPAGSPCAITGERPFDRSSLEAIADFTWVCEHRDPALRAMVAFRKATHGEPVTITSNGSTDTLSLSRGTKGFVVINGSNDVLEETFDTRLPEGTYCDVIASDDPIECDPAHRVTVAASGAATITVAPQKAAAFHVQGP